MSMYAKEFETLTKQLFPNRLKALEVIFSYLAQDDFKNLLIYYADPKVKQALLPPELEFLEGVSRLHFGFDSDKPHVEKKPSH